MLKKVLFFILAGMLVLLAVSCTEADENSEISVPAAESVDNSLSEPETSQNVNMDVIPPAFIDAVDGALPPLTHNAGEEIDFLSDIVARDNVTADDAITVSVSDDGGYNKDVAGVYTLKITAEDENGNASLAILQITVKEVSSQSVISFSGNYAVGTADALSYTTSGTKFRTVDVIQVMDTDTFVKQYNEFSADHVNNGGVPFFPNGVIIITDKDYNIIQVRIAAGENIQIDADGSVKNSGFGWSNSIDAANGGGMFKGILSDLTSLVPDGGYIMFVGNPGDQTCRIFLIRELFFSGYVSGAVTLDVNDVDLSNTAISLE